MTQARGRIDWSPQGDQIGGGLMDVVQRGFKIAGKTMLQSAPKVGRIVLNRIPGLPGLVLDGAQLATAPDMSSKRRVGAQIVGGMVGGAAGVWAGPVGVAVGSTLGQKAGELIYDHQDEIRHKI